MALVDAYDSDSSDASNSAEDKRKLRNSNESVRRKKSRRIGKGPWAKWESSSEEEEKGSEEVIDYTDLDLGSSIDKSDTDVIEKSFFLGKREKDYQGRGILYPPVDIDIDLKRKALTFECFLPKKKIHEYKGHKKGTNSLRFIPGTGHLLLSGGNDNVVNIWDFYHDRELLRNYQGHSMPVRDLNFSHDGKSFGSISYDRWLKVWDTEKGDVSFRLHLNSFPNCLAFNPIDKNQLIVGLSNSEIQHYDLRVAEKNGLIQTYDHHQGSIIALNYFPDGTKILSSSEDKTVRIWNNQINIPIKQISDTKQHSMPWINIHPQHDCFSTQSMDNTIYSYSMNPKYRRKMGHTFKGHTTAGYGIHFDFSPDGRYVVSGDAKGRVFIWDWKTTKLLKTLKPLGNELPITCVQWNPQQTSKICCSGNDGRIVIYD